MRSIIKGTGSYLPKKILSNDDLATFLDTSDEWITSRTGIRQRHCADPKLETTSYMAIKAAEGALSMAKTSPLDLDLILVGTVTPDYRMPTVACMVQEGLQAKNAAALDIGAACAGSIYALSIADAFLKAGKYKNILVVASESMSSVIDWQDRNTAVLFGDGASAAVVCGNDQDQSGFIDFDLYADGAQQKTIWVKAGGSAVPIDNQALLEKADKVIMNGREVFKFAVRAVTEAIQKIIDKNHIATKDIALVVPHQANLRIIDAIAERMNVPKDRFLINLDRCANTSAASLLLAYDEASRTGRIKKGDLILMLAIGAGFVWGASLYRA
ncbi:MAG TPA: beta-ketoacyl-ACP synthase III [Myxococcota bacterium]|nr:beta-ketoacyl-ACP synthase III [Myxococcota bacterium]